VPLAYVVMVVVSLLAARRGPGAVGATTLRPHAPDSVRLWNF